MLRTTIRRLSGAGVQGNSAQMQFAAPSFSMQQMLSTWQGGFVVGFPVGLVAWTQFFHKDGMDVCWIRPNDTRRSWS